MEDLRRDLPASDEVELPSEVLAGINRGIKDADEGRALSLEEAMEMIPKWISKFEFHKRR
jgi:predicted transcriptional regulator